jgi:hypothetical protein
MTCFNFHDPWFINLICGALGGVASVLVKDNCIELPTRKDNKLFLGSLGGVFIAAIAGVIGNNNPVNAFIWGAAGVAFVERLIARAPDIICKDVDKLIDKNKEG